VSAEEISALASYSQDNADRLTALERFTAVAPLELALQQPRPRLIFILRMLGQWDIADLEPFVADLQASLDRYVEVSVIGEGRKRRLETLGGPPFLVEVLNGLTYHIPPLAFFQSNSAMAVELIDQALRAIEQTGLKLAGARMLDIYCGVGTFALQMARRGAQVLGIEEYEGAVQAAQENARLNDLENQCQFVAAKAEEYILQLEEKGEHFDGALLDPPRRGCDPALLQSLLKTRPPVLVYVSCDPSTLARDIKILAEGYELLSSRVVDLFPQTYHMESVSVLRRK
jgi:23S rRNA (uracil1939-C5)-methyltransferase